MFLVSHRRGFTLIELMVVLAVIALVATLAVPAVSALTGANARKAASELAGSMRFGDDAGGVRLRDGDQRHGGGIPVGARTRGGDAIADAGDVAFD